MAGACENSYPTYRPVIYWRQEGKSGMREGGTKGTQRTQERAFGDKGRAEADLPGAAPESFRGCPAYHRPPYRAFSSRLRRELIKWRRGSAALLLCFGFS